MIVALRAPRRRSYLQAGVRSGRVEETVRFGLDGASDEIDMSAKPAERSRASLPSSSCPPASWVVPESPWLLGGRGVAVRLGGIDGRVRPSVSGPGTRASTCPTVAGFRATSLGST